MNEVRRRRPFEILLHSPPVPAGRLWCFCSPHLRAGRVKKMRAVALFSSLHDVIIAMAIICSFMID